MEHTKTVEIDGRTVDVTVYPDDSARAKVQTPPPEAILSTQSGAELHLSDLTAADIRVDEDEYGLLVAYFNDDAQHVDSPYNGNPLGGDETYDRNWYFTDLLRPEQE